MESDLLKQLENSLISYQENQETLDIVVHSAKRLFGDDWMTSLPQAFDEAEMDERTKVLLKDKANHAIHYHSALIAWQEAYAYLNDPSSITAEDLAERVPVLEYWLSLFGNEGADLAQKVKDLYLSKLKEQPAVSDEQQSADNASTESIPEAQENVIPEENPVQQEAAEIPVEPPASEVIPEEPTEKVAIQEENVIQEEAVEQIPALQEEIIETPAEEVSAVQEEPIIAQETVAEEVVSEKPIEEVTLQEENVVQEEPTIQEEAVEPTPVQEEQAPVQEEVTEETIEKIPAPEEPVVQETTVQEENVVQEEAVQEEKTEEVSVVKEETIETPAEEVTVQEESAPQENLVEETAPQEENVVQETPVEETASQEEPASQETLAEEPQKEEISEVSQEKVAEEEVVIQKETVEETTASEEPTVLEEPIKQEEVPVKEEVVEKSTEEVVTQEENSVQEEPVKQEVTVEENITTKEQTAEPVEETPAKEEETTETPVEETASQEETVPQDAENIASQETEKEVTTSEEAPEKIVWEDKNTSGGVSLEDLINLEKDISATAASVAPRPKGIKKEQADPQIVLQNWDIAMYMKQKELYDSANNWLSAWCIRMDNAERTSYPFYGFIVDLMHDLKEKAQLVLENQLLEDIVDREIPDGCEGIKRVVEAIDEEFEYLPDDFKTSTAEKIKLNAREILGKIDTSTEREIIEKAPDGFELMDDPYEASTQQIIEDFEKTEKEAQNKIDKLNVIEDNKKNNKKRDKKE